MKRMNFEELYAYFVELCGLAVTLCHTMKTLSCTKL